MAAIPQFSEIIENHRLGTVTILSINLKSGNNIHLNRAIEGTLRIEGECICWEEIKSGLRNTDQLVHMVCDVEEISHISFIDGYSEIDRSEEEIPRLLKEQVDKIIGG